VLATTFAPISNWMMRRSLFKRVMNVAPERTMPAFTFNTFEKWWRNHQPKTQNSKLKIVLFVDTFTRYNHPHIGIDAVEVLERAGVEVIIPPWKCCGRPMLSQGQPKVMLGWARFNVAQLAPYAKQGIPILSLEPSCISAFKDDYLDLIPSEDTSAVAKMTMSIEEFLSAENHLMDLSRNSNLKIQNSKLILHGHCHQKSSYGTKGARAALAQTGCDVSEIDSTCCGMAGAFGYEAEHYALSQQVGELSVLPAVRDAPEGTLIVAPGTSCRDQIRHFTGKEALHPIEVIARRLRELDANQDAKTQIQNGDLTI